MVLLPFLSGIIITIIITIIISFQQQELRLKFLLRK